METEGTVAVAATTTTARDANTLMAAANDARLGLIRMFIYFRQMSFLRHLGFLRQRLLHHVAQISKFSGKCRDMSRHLINFFKANVIFRCRDILIRPNLAPACLTAARVPYLAARASSPLAYGALSSPYARDYREPHHLVGL